MKRLRLTNQSSPSSFSLVNLHKHMFGITPAQSHGVKVNGSTGLRITVQRFQVARKCGANQGHQDFIKDYSNHESYYNKYDDETFVFLGIKTIKTI